MLSILVYSNVFEFSAAILEKGLLVFNILLRLLFVIFPAFFLYCIAIVFFHLRWSNKAHYYMNMLFLGAEAKKIVLYDVLYVPKLTCSLFFLQTAVAKGNAVEFGPNNCCIWDENGKLRGKGSLADKLYQLDCQVVTTGYASVASSRCDLWHQRLGHVHESRLKKCVQNELVQGIDIERMTELSFCEGCLSGKNVSRTVSHSGRDSVDA